MKIKSFRDLDVWKLSIEMADSIYDITTSFPKEEIYGLSSQLRRCSVSVASNIAEGSARGGTKELVQFLYIARGSVAEIETQIEIAHRRRYCDEEQYCKICDMCGSVNRMLTRLQQSLQMA